MKFPPIDVLLGLAFSVLALLRPAWQRIKNLPARSWMTVQGMIRGVTVSRQHGLVRSYLVNATYTYVLNGEYYAGSYDRTFLWKSSAEAFAANLKGQMAVVRYQLNAAERSTLLEQDQYGWPN